MAINSDYSLSDIAAVTNGGNGGNDGFGFGGGNGAWWLLVLFLFAFAGGNWGGFGGFGGGSGGGAAENYVLTSDFAQVERKLDSISNGLCDGFYAQNSTMLNGFANAELSRANNAAAIMQQLNNMAAQNAQCCCENKAAIADLKYTVATGDCATQRTIENAARDIIESGNANYRALHEEIVQNRMADKDAQIAALTQQVNGLSLAASQAAQNQYLVGQLRPCPVPAYNVPNPYAYNGCGFGCGC